ncbi:putative RiPP precursor [Mesorhizobium sp. NFR06]|nr:putative RiPP precursor [Mesorhizobium sp. NFR06]
MKKIYEKPTFVRKGKLSAIVSTISVIIVPPPG